MKVIKSSRHSKITGDFAESLILYWLSKYGFECAKVDHTGIDIIARNPHTDEVMGISVKGRSRNTGTEGTYVSIPNDNFVKIEKACKAFNCVPYFAIVVDQEDMIFAFIIHKEELLRMFPKRQRAAGWKMTEKHLAEYVKNPKIMTFQFTYQTTSWWK